MPQTLSPRIFHRCYDGRLPRGCRRRTARPLPPLFAKLGVIGAVEEMASLVPRGSYNE